MKKELDTILQAFKFSTLQAVSQVRQVLRENSVTWKEFDAWVDNKKTESLPIRTCPECGRSLLLGSVNDSPSTQVGGGFKSQWFCSCGWNELSENEPSKEIAVYKR